MITRSAATIPSAWGAPYTMTWVPGAGDQSFDIEAQRPKRRQVGFGQGAQPVLLRVRKVVGPALVLGLP